MQLLLAALALWLLLLILRDGVFGGDGFGVLVALGVFVIGGYYYVGWLRRLLPAVVRPDQYVGLRRLEHLGPLPDVVQSLTDELAKPDNEICGIRISRNWILFPTWIRFRPLNIVDVMWLHEKRTMLLGVIPVDSSLQLYDRIGESYERKGPRAEIQALLREIAGRAPWAVVGYDEKRRATFADPIGRQSIIAGVDARRIAADARRQ